ncbi:MAG: general secretion pathway protein GspK [Kiloniellaceae bacterium]
MAVLWVVSLLAAIAAGFATTMRTEVVVARNQIDNAEARSLADAGFYRAVIALASEGETLPRDGSAREWAFAGGVVIASVQAEGGKVDLNGADAELLAGLFAGAGAANPRNLAHAVIDYRDADSDPLPGGAEDADYRAAGLGHEAKDRPFERRDELLQVMGMTREVYDAVAPAITVYSRSRGIDPATAPALALAALSRMGADGGEALAGQRVGKTLKDLRALYGDSPYVVPSNIPVITMRREPVVTIRSEATTPSGAVFVRESVVALTPGLRRPFHLLTWEQGRR